MKNYGFADGNGNDITRGMQLWPHEARRHAQRLADERGIAVSYWDESAPLNEDDENVSLDTVEPRGDRP